MIKLSAAGTDIYHGNENIKRRFYFKQSKSANISALKNAYGKIRLKKQLQYISQTCQQFQDNQFLKKISERIINRSQQKFQTSYTLYKNQQLSDRYQHILRTNSDVCHFRFESKRKKVHSSTDSKIQVKKGMQLGNSSDVCQRSSFHTSGETSDLKGSNLQILITKIKQRSDPMSKNSVRKHNWGAKHKNYTVNMWEPTLRIHSTPCRPWSTGWQKQGQIQMPSKQNSEQT